MNFVLSLPSHRVQLKSTKQLLGRAGERFLLLGMLTHNKEGDLCLEDSDGSVKLDFSQLVGSIAPQQVFILRRKSTCLFSG